MTKYLGLIGYPLGHSVSPAFQQAALDHCDLDIKYQAWETPPEELRDVVASLNHPDRLGMNVTVPYKQAVMPLIDKATAAVEEIGAVNTIVKESGQLVGHNTDCVGFIQALKQEGGFDPKGAKILVLGIGGGARGVTYGLICEGASLIAIAGRHGHNARVFAESFMAEGLRRGTRVTIGEWWKEGMRRTLGFYDMVVNTTPMGMRGNAAENESPLDGVDIPPSQFVYDIVYNPAETPLIKQAKAVGARYLGGLPMLVYQGAASFELWTGKTAPVDVMMAAAKQALGRE